MGLLRALMMLGYICLSVGLAQAGEIHFPLRVEGRYLVDANQQRVKLKAVNWYGPHLGRQVSEGLEHQPLPQIMRLIKEWGFNTVRLPFSNMMLHDGSPVSAELLRANPQLQGKTALEVFIATVEALTSAGLMVVLNNHTTYSEWCCGFDYNGLWYHTRSSLAQNQSTEMWEADWLMLVERFQDNPHVVGVDLRNEVRTMRLADTHIPESPNWGWRNRNDWHLAAQNLGNKILKRHPHLLIVVEGINWWGMIPILGSGERPHLKPIRELPIHLRRPDKLVYAAHNYSYTGPRHTGDDKTSGNNLHYRDLERDALFAVLDEEFGYVVEPQRYYTAPVWVNEFGIARDTSDPRDRQWFIHLIDYLIENDLDFAYWPLNHEGYGLVSSDWSQALTDDWRYPHLRRLLTAPGKTGPYDEMQFRNLAIKEVDDQQSNPEHDWLPGGRKGTCPENFRLIGLSQDHRALCTNAHRRELRDETQGDHVEAIQETALRAHASGDWASGFTKYECPLGRYVAGFSRHWWGDSGILCTSSRQPLGLGCRTLWFDRQDARLSTLGGDFAPGSRKGQCTEEEYVAGFAHRDGTASALLCCRLAPERF
jgi:aryl-phospho-beta-D-glucosidase BglC (GH1 family)